MATGAGVNAATAVSQYTKFRQIARLQVQNARALGTLTDEQRLIYASSDGDIEQLVNKLKKDDTDLDDDIQSRKARIETLLAALGDKDGQIEANNALNKTTKSQGSKADAHAAVEQIAKSCVDFAQDSGLKVNLAEAAAHECKLVAAEGSAEEGFLLKNFQSVPPGEYSLAQVAQALRLLVERATNAEADARSKQGQLEAAQQEKSGIVKEKEEVAKLLKKEKDASKELAAKLSTEQGSYNKAKDEVTRLTLDNAHLPDLRNKNATLEKDIKTEKLLTEKLEAEKKELAVKSPELDRLRQEITTHTERVAELEGQVNTLKEEAWTYKGEIAGIEEDLEECQKASHPDEGLQADLSRTQSLLEQAKDEHAALVNQIDAAHNSWAKALVDVLEAAAIGSEVSSNSISLILRQSDARFASLDDFTVAPVNPYPLAQEWQGMQPLKLTPPSMLDLLKMTLGLASSQGADDDLTRLLWLDCTLLESVRTRSLTGPWVLLALRVILQAAEKTTGLARCLAYVQLSTLVTQYRPQERVMWQDVLQGLINNHSGLSIDILGQACLAHLALTADDPSTTASTIHTAVAHAFGEARITANMSIQEIISQISAEQAINDALCTEESGITIVVVHMLSQEIVFINHGASWLCSTQELSFTAKGNSTVMSWGSTDSITIPAQGALRSWLDRHHKNDLIKAQLVKSNQRGKNLLARLRR